jgi:predicted metalloendopeptidase
MTTPADRSTQAPSTRNSQHVNDAVTTNKALSTSKEQISHPASKNTQQTIDRWKRVSVLAEQLSGEMSRERSGHLSFVNDRRQKMNEEVTALDDKEKKRLESAMLVRTMLSIRATGKIC